MRLCGARQDFTTEITYYQQVNPTSSFADQTVYAALELYGDAITITKLENGATNSTPLKVNDQDEIIASPCP